MDEVLESSGASSPLVKVLAGAQGHRPRRARGGLLGHQRAGRAEFGFAGPTEGRDAAADGLLRRRGRRCATAGLAASLAREEGIEAELPLAVLAGVAAGSKPKLALPKRVLLLDYRFLELLGPVNAVQLFDKAEPALLAVLASDTGSDARLRTAAAEAALRLNALSPEA